MVMYDRNANQVPVQCPKGTHQWKDRGGGGLLKVILPEKITRQNSSGSTQKLPALTNESKSNCSSRGNLSIGLSRSAVPSPAKGRISSTQLPCLNNNKGEFSLEQTCDALSPNANYWTSDTNSPVKPLTPAEAVQSYCHQLTSFEKKEIEAYTQIYFLGIGSKKVDGLQDGPLNAGYDDDNGSYIKVMHDHISYRYEILEVIGKGSFGQVIKAIDHKKGGEVAIKIIRNKKRFHHQALIEVKILDHLRRKDKDQKHNVVHMMDYFYFRNHLCITFELMGMNLYELIKMNNYQGLSVGLIQRFAYSLIQCLQLLAKENIIHCDLKPENVLLKDKGGTSIRVIDFGSSCYTHQRVYTYIQSRFYRSPEVILGIPYSVSIDMWSFGCILAELYTGYPLFPGENEVEQLACIMEALGIPDHQLLANASRRRLFFDSKDAPRCIVNSKGKKRRPGSRDLNSILKCPDVQFVNFISRCLEWDPTQRMSPDDALHDKWLQGLLLVSPKSVTQRRPGPLHDKTVEDGSNSQYRVYKNRRHTTKSQHDISIEKLKDSSDSKSKENRENAVQNSDLEDSGSFLSPVL